MDTIYTYHICLYGFNAFNLAVTKSPVQQVMAGDMCFLKDFSNLLTANYV